MGKNCIQHIVVLDEGIESRLLTDEVSVFHAEVIERRLRQSDLTTEQKTAVIDRMIEKLRSYEAEEANQ